MTLEEVIKSSEVIIHKGRYAYLKAKSEKIDDYFLLSKDVDEITAVVEENNLDKVEYDQDVKWYKLVEIKVAIPFTTVGFLAKVTKTIADEGLNVLVVSTFSKDYILVKEETWERAIDALKNVGFPITIL